MKREERKFRVTVKTVFKYLEKLPYGKSKLNPKAKNKNNNKIKLELVCRSHRKVDLSSIKTNMVFLLQLFKNGTERLRK